MVKLTPPFVHFYISTKSWRGYIFTAVCLCVCRSVCLSVCLSVRHFLWTKFQPNGYTDLDAVFGKWLIISLARTQLKMVTFDQRSRSQWLNNHFFLLILYLLPYCLIRHIRAEIYSREVNKELIRKNGYWVTVTLTFDQRSPFSIGFEPVI